MANATMRFEPTGDVVRSFLFRCVLPERDIPSLEAIAAALVPGRAEAG